MKHVVENIERIKARILASYNLRDEDLLKGEDVLTADDLVREHGSDFLTDANKRRYESDIVKAFEGKLLTDEEFISKAKDVSKLVRKRVQTKSGHFTTVWVNPSKDKDGGKIFLAS